MRANRIKQRLVVVVIAIVAGSITPARGQPGLDGHSDTSSAETPPLTPPATMAQGATRGERPWARGVPPEEQARAIELYELGNGLLADTRFEAAVAKYREALQHWNHPGIHYNLMLALVSLGQAVEAYSSSQHALRHGPDALQAGEHRRALEYRAMLRKRIAELQVVCDQPDAIVTLDGKALVVTSGRVEKLVAPDTYVLVARKPGYVAFNQTITLAAGATIQVKIHMDPARIETELRTTRRWPSWKPWSGVGLASAMGLLGVVLHNRANDTHRLHDTTVRLSCPNGCGANEVPPGLPELAAKGRRQRVLGGMAFTASAAIMATSLYFVYLNRPRLREVRSPSSSLTVAPTIDRDSVGVAAALVF